MSVLKTSASGSSIDFQIQTPGGELKVGEPRVEFQRSRQYGNGYRPGGRIAKPINGGERERASADEPDGRRIPDVISVFQGGAIRGTEAPARLARDTFTHTFWVAIAPLSCSKKRPPSRWTPMPQQ